MIGKITIGKSFRGCILYCLNDKKQVPGKEQVMRDRAEVILFNQCFGNDRELISQFNAVRQLNPKLAKPVLHVTLSLALDDQLGKDKLMEMCEQCAKEMGFANNQFIAAHHRDTKHSHLHIVANRIGFDGRTVNNSNNYKKVAAYCRKMELKYELKQVLSPRKFLSQDQRLIPRHDTRKEAIKADIEKSLSASKNYVEFERLMKEKNYHVIKARGIAFIDEKKVYVKGSELGYSLKTIERILEENALKFNRQEAIHKTQSPHSKPIDREHFEPNASTNYNNDLKQVSKTVNDLIKPEEDNSQVPYKLTHTKKKKKGLRI
jgi:hypothetical protein